MAELHAHSAQVMDVLVPLQVISCVAYSAPGLTSRRLVDDNKNPHGYSRDFFERVASENQYTSGILHNVEVRAMRSSPCRS